MIYRQSLSQYGKCLGKRRTGKLGFKSVGQNQANQQRHRVSVLLKLQNRPIQVSGYHTGGALWSK